MQENVLNKSRLARIFLFLFALVFFASPAFASEEFLSEKWLFNGDSFVANSQAFIMHMDYNTIIYVSSDLGSVGIPYGSCSKINSTKICYNLSTFDADKRAMKAKLLVFSVAPKITVYRQVSRPFVYVDEEAVVSVSINNTGGMATTVDYIDEFPDSLQLMYASGCIIDGHTMKWSGLVGKDSGYTCYFTIKPNDDLYRSIKARAVYYDGQQLKTIYSEAITVDARHFLVLAASASESSLLNGQIVNLTLNLSSRYYKMLNDRLAASVEVIIPESMVFYSASDIIKKVNDNVYNWSLTLYQNNTAQIVLRLRPKRIGTSEVVVKASYETDTGNFSLEDRKVPFTVTGKDLIVISEIKKGVSLETELETGEEYWLLVYVQNPNQYVVFKNVNMTFFTNLTYVENVILPYLNGSSQRIPVNINFKAPFVESTASYPFNININYSTEFGDYSYATLRKSISVRSPETPYITYVLTPSGNIESKDEFTVKVQVRNPRKTGINNVKISTKVLSAFKVSGVPDVITNINKAATLDAYELKLTAPRTLFDKTYVFNTTVSYVDEATGKTIFTYKEQSLKITPKQIKLSYNRRVSDTKIFKNKVLQLDHLITSNDDEEFKNLVITFPVQKYVDVIGSVNHAVNEISPGESMTLTGIEKIRVKEKDSIVLEPVTIRYQDLGGEYSNSTFGAISLGMASGYSEDMGPSLVADKKISVSKIDRSQDQNVSVVILLRNIGDAIADQIYLSDEYRQMALADLAPGMQVEVLYNISGNDIKSSGMIKRSIISYADSGGKHKYYTASEDLFVSVVEPKPAAAEIKTTAISAEQAQPEPQEEQIQQAQPQEEQKTKGFFANLWDSIKKILFWKRNQ